MENIQNIPGVVLDSKKTNIFKILFFISLFIIIGQIVCIYSILNKYKTNQNTPQKQTEISEITSTKNQSTELKAYTKSNDKKINLILNQNGEEIVIDSLEKDGQTELYNPGFNNIRFSSSLTYLIYNVNYMESSIRFYNTKTHFFVKNGEFDGFMLQSSTGALITDDEKYVIFCSGGGYGGIDGGKIINTSDSSVKFDFVKYLGNKITDPDISCRVDNKKIIFSYNGDKELKYSLDSSSLVN